jgi:ribonuclease HI
LSLAAAGGVTEIVIYGDCQPVLSQLRNEWAVRDLLAYYGRVREIEQRCGVPIRYEYLPEADTRYAKVDQLSKRGKRMVQEVFR